MKGKKTESMPVSENVGGLRTKALTRSVIVLGQDKANSELDLLIICFSPIIIEQYLKKVIWRCRNNVYSW